MGEPRKPVLFRISVELHERLRAAAEERDVSMTYLASKALEEFLPNLIPVDEFTLTKPRSE